MEIASEKNSDMCCRYCIDDTDDELLTFTGKKAMTSIMNRVHDGDAELAAPFVPLQNERRELGVCSRLPSARSHRSKEEARNVKK